MASTSKGRSSRRKAQAPGKLGVQVKEAKVVSDDSVEESEEETAIENGIPKDLPEGTVIVQPEAVEDAVSKAKKAPPVRIDTSVLDNVACTACGRQLNPYKNGAFQKHPELKVIICRRCEKFLNSGDISKDKDGSDEQCRWCGQGGRLSVCDECSKAFCKSCIMRNFNRSEFNKINEQKKWCCYLCDKAPLQGLRENYRNVRDTLKALQARDKAKAAAASGNKTANTNGTARSSKSGTTLIPQATRDMTVNVHDNNSDFTGFGPEDLNFDNVGLAGFIDKLSVATNTFRDMLRALRSQFDGRGEDDDDVSPSTINFVMGTNLHEQEKEQRCGKALSKGLEAYLNSLKTILSAHGKGGVQVQHIDQQKASGSSPEILNVVNKSVHNKAKPVKANIQRESSKQTEEKHNKSAKSNRIESDSEEDVIVLSDTDRDSPKKGKSLLSPTKLSSRRKLQRELPKGQSQKSKSNKHVDNAAAKLATPDTETDDNNEEENIEARLDLLNEQESGNREKEAVNGNENVVAEDDLSQKESVSTNCDTQASDDENIAAKNDLLDEETETVNEDENVAAKNDLLDKEKETVNEDENIAAKNDLLDEENETVNEDENIAAKNDLLDEETESRNCDNETINDGENIAAKSDLLDEETGSMDHDSETINDDENMAAKNDLLQDESDTSDSDAENADENMAAKFDLLNELTEKMVDDDDNEEGESTDQCTKTISQKEIVKKDKAKEKDSDKSLAKEKDSDKSLAKEKDSDKSLAKEKDSDKSLAKEKDSDKSLAEDGKSKESNYSRSKRQSSKLNDDESKGRDNVPDDVSDMSVSDDNQEGTLKRKKSKTQRSQKPGGIHTKDKFPTEHTLEEEEKEKSEETKADSGSDLEVHKDACHKKKTRVSNSDSDSDTKEIKVVKGKCILKSKSKKSNGAGKNKPSKSTIASKSKRAVPDCVSSDVSSSDLLLSSGDDLGGPPASTRKKKRTKRKDAADEEKVEKPKAKDIRLVIKKEQEKEKKPQAKIDSSAAKSGLEKNEKSSKEKQAQPKAEDKRNKEKLETAKPKLNGKKKEVKSEEDEEDDMDKEIEKLAKLPALRKRKAKEMEEDGDNDEDDGKDNNEEKETKAPKKLKPGPKFTKVGKNNTDYDNLSSDDEKSASDHDEEEDEDDDLVPKVSFCLEPMDEENNADESDKMSQKEAGKDDSDEEEEDKNSDIDSSSEDDEEDTKKKSKKKQGGDSKKKASKTEEEETDKTDKALDKDSDDSEDEDSKKKKPISSKLLDAKISDSDDSDIGRPTKKKKASDDEASEASKGEESSSGSSLPSDSLEDENDDSEDASGEEDEDGKKKKKGKKKGGKRKKKRKGKKGSDDEDEEDGSDEDGKKKKGKGKKRKRIKKIADSSDDQDKDDDDDDDDDEKNKSGKRKQIRKVMSNKKLEDSTRAAAKAEEKRRKRIAAKQREFNVETITDDNNPMNCPITTKLILEPGKEEGDPPIVQVNKKLIQKLKPHQVEAVQFMWDCMFESVKRSKKEEGAGCILAHCMGLGKTLSVISFVHTILSHRKQLNQKTCLVVSPLNTVLNWQNEWGIWLDEEDQLDVWELAGCKQNPARADMLKEWHTSGGIMIIGYEMYRNLSQGARCKNKRQKKVFYETLVNPGPDMVVCDEGHILKNEASSISKAMNQMKTRRRVVLTGTPLQNNLNEYHCMLSFVKPNLLGTRKEFNNRFISPIQNGQCTDSTQRDFKLMKARAHVLHEMLAGCVQRRDYSALTKFLPPKQEYVISVRLTNVQIDLYEKYMQMSGQGVDGVFTNKGARLFSDYQNLMKIWTHPWVLKLAEIRDEQKMKYDDEDSFIDDESDAERSFSSSGSSSEEEKLVLSDSGGEGTSLGPNSKKGTRRTRAKARRQAGEDSDPEEVIAEWKSKTRNRENSTEDEKLPEGPKSVTKEWWAAYVTEEDQHKVELGNKLFLLFEILKMCEEIGDKVLIFSQSILSLNIIESFLETVDSKFQQECDELKEGEVKEEEEQFGRSWTKNLDYYRMDGSTSAQNRQLWAANFNDIENHRTRLFLISTKAGGLGINLVAANRVIIFDASWNPSHDVQSIFRVYRFGQTKPCYIYRFLAQGTMEEKIYERQVTKLSLSQRVVDEHQIERHFSANDLKELYNFRPDRWDDGTEKPTLALPKDPLLAEILTNHKHCVLSFHEHDSLLENQIEQTLTEEEKKAAWEEYENEKKGIIIRGPGMERTASWPMMAAAQILSREQITATVQALRQRLPDISEELFHLHVQQELRRQVQLRQEEMRRMEMLRMQEIQIMNMIKYQAQQSGLTFEEAQTQMAPWIQMQMQQMHRMRTAMQSQLMAAGMTGMHPSSSMPMMGNSAERISNNPEDAIDLDEN